MTGRELYAGAVTKSALSSELAAGRYSELQRPATIERRGHSLGRNKMKGRRRFGFPVPSFTQSSKKALRSLFVAGMIVLGPCGSIASADSNDLRSRLERLAADSNFAIEGLEWIGSEAVGDARGSVSERVNFLLQDYNHLLIQNERGEIKKVLITGHKTTEDKRWRDSATVYTVRVGNHHQVEAAVAGPSGVVRIVRLMVDTGATSLVLPTSMIGELGFGEGDFRPAIGWTANGPAPLLVGMLHSVRVGAAYADNVKVSFVPDQKLRGVMLLGMSFLERFRMTIDNERNELLLLTK